MGVSPRVGPRARQATGARGWGYAKHLAGRAFAVVAHGDATGERVLRHVLTDWLGDLRLTPAADAGLLDRYVGYYGPYATSHDALDADGAFQEEVRNAARALAKQVMFVREHRSEADDGLADPRAR